MKKNNPNEEELNQNDELISENMNEESIEQEISENAIPDDQGAELLKAQAEIEISKDKYIRLYSEFENFRRRTAKEKIEMSLTANEQLIKSLLPVIDDFERAEKAVQDKTNKDIEGYQLIQSKFRKVLEQSGVKAMEIGPGAEFNADFQEAITQIPAPEEKLKGKVVDVVEKGYLLNEKVIRFAKVVIGG
jgi:molecular chaperone GrpE